MGHIGRYKLVTFTAAAANKLFTREVWAIAPSWLLVGD